MKLPTQQAQRHFLVDIDMLYDVRLALLDTIDPSYAIKAIHTNSYMSRTSDYSLSHALGLNKKAWDGRYSGQFSTLVKQSHPTFLRNNIIPLTNEVLDDDIPGMQSVKRLTVNVPYGHSFSPEEEAKFILLLSELYEGYFESISVIYRDHSQLTYYKLVDKYTDYFCYRYDLWFKTYHEHEPEKHLPSFRLWLPKLLWGSEDDLDPKTKPEVLDLVKQHSVFTMMQFSYMPSFALHWLELREVLDERIRFIDKTKKE